MVSSHLMFKTNLVIHILNERANHFFNVYHLGFTAAPIPTDYYYEGAYGNNATCTAQGFFIQVGTVAAYTNVSLAFYYFLAIRKGLNEVQLHSYRLCFLLCPIILGLAFAFAGKLSFNILLFPFVKMITSIFLSPTGLSYYGNVFLWW